MILTRWKFHLSVLRHACEQRSTARVAAAPAASEFAGASTRFVALARDGILLEWPKPASADQEQISYSGALVDVRFDYRAIPLTFRTETMGRVWWATPAAAGAAESDCWKLRLPLCLIPVRPRVAESIRLPGHDPIILRCTSVANPQHHFTGRLEALTTHGLTGRADAACLELCIPGAMFWAQFQVPGESGRIEFVVRVSDAHPEPGSRVMTFRTDFCPSDDPALTAGHLARLARCARTSAVANRQAHAPAGPAQIRELERC